MRQSHHRLSQVVSLHTCRPGLPNTQSSVQDLSIACEVHVKDIAVAGKKKKKISQRDCRIPIKSITFGFHRRFPPPFCRKIDKISATAVGSRVPWHSRKH